MPQFVFLAPAPALANCMAGGTPSYHDITYIRVRQYSLVGILHPRYEFEAISVPPAGSRSARVTASLSAHRAVPYFGNFVAMNPKQDFDDVAGVLEREPLLRHAHDGSEMLRHRRAGRLNNGYSL